MEILERIPGTRHVDLVEGFQPEIFPAAGSLPENTHVEAPPVAKQIQTVGTQRLIAVEFRLGQPVFVVHLSVAIQVFVEYITRRKILPLIRRVGNILPLLRNPRRHPAVGKVIGHIEVGESFAQEFVPLQQAVLVERHVQR